MANGRDRITYSYNKNGSLVQKVLSSRTYGRLTDAYTYTALDQLTFYISYDGYRQQFTGRLTAYLNTPKTTPRIPGMISSGLLF